jgi:choline dehydrogenase
MPGIGARLQDHFNVELVYRLRDPISLNDDLRRMSWRIRAVAQWLARRDGPLVASPAHVLAFVRSSEVLTRPDLQFHFLPISLDEQRRPHRFSAASLDVCQLNPTSHGVVQARSPDVRVKPSIRLESLATEFDRNTVVAGIKVARAIARSGALARLISSELKPSDGVQTDEELLSFARQAGGSIYHPVGTCRMGSDQSAVVDQRLRVIGVRNMRISDCSIAPRIISGNTNACAIMIAERAADMIRQDARHLP